jgi:hypothetical protein
MSNGSSEEERSTLDPPDGRASAKVLQRVLDILEIQALKALYCEAVDSSVKDRAQASQQLRELCLEDVMGDLGFGVQKGRDELIKFIMQGLSGTSDWLFHAIHSPRIEVNGDVAIGRWTVIAGTRAKGAGQVLMSTGRYRDVFRRTSAGWKMQDVVFVMETSFWVDPADLSQS